MDQEASPSGGLVVDAAAASNSVSVVRDIRRLLITAVLAALVCSWVISASKGGCVDPTGTCVDLRLSVGPLLYVGFAGVVLFALSRIVNRHLDPFEATRVLDHARIVVVILAAVAIVVAHVWFWATPWEGFDTSGFVDVSPFPFGIIDVRFSPAR